MLRIIAQSLKPMAHCIEKSPELPVDQKCHNTIQTGFDPKISNTAAGTGKLHIYKGQLQTRGTLISKQISRHNDQRSVQISTTQSVY